MATFSHPFAVGNSSENRKQSGNHKDFESLLRRKVDREYTKIVFQVNVSTGQFIGRIFPSVEDFSQKCT
jgi:hypothetical protein